MQPNYMQPNYMYPNYVARKSIAAHWTFTAILLSIITFGIGFIYLICKTIEVSSYSIEFYDDRIVTKRGVFNRSEIQSVFMGVYSVNVRQSLAGRWFNYGDIYVDCVGKWDVSTIKIKDPHGLKCYLETRINRMPPPANVIFN